MGLGGSGEPMSLAPILCVGVSPCIQRTIRFARLAAGRVNRARAVSISASAKATNVCRVVQALGGRPRLITLLGGATGEEFLRRVEAEGLPTDPIRAEGATRVCQTLIDEESGQVTELVEEAPTPMAADWVALEGVLGRRLPGAGAQVLSGRLPPGSPPDTYARWIRMARAAGVPAYVDTQQAPLRHAVAEGPFVVKINAEELAASYPGAGDGAGDPRPAMARLREAGVDWVLITCGAGPAVLSGREGTWRYRMPALPAVNPIGSGDATLAGLALAVQWGLPVPEAARYGLACGCANAVTDEPGQVRTEDVGALLGRIRVEAL